MSRSQENASTSLSAADPSDYNQRKRFEEIHEARRRVVEQKRAVLNAKNDPSQRISQRQARDVVREAVQSYLDEVESLIYRHRENVVDAENTDATDYWEEPEIGTMQLPGDQQMTFVGLKSFQECGDPVSVTVKRQVEDPIAGVQVTHETVTRQIPINISMEAYRCINRFLADVGLDLEMEEAKPDAFFEYDDLIPPDEKDDEVA